MAQEGGWWWVSGCGGDHGRRLALPSGVKGGALHGLDPGGRNRSRVLQGKAVSICCVPPALDRSSLHSQQTQGWLLRPCPEAREVSWLLQGHTGSGLESSNTCLWLTLHVALCGIQGPCGHAGSRTGLGRGCPVPMAGPWGVWGSLAQACSSQSLGKRGVQRPKHSEHPQPFCRNR